MFASLVGAALAFELRAGGPTDLPGHVVLRAALLGCCANLEGASAQGAEALSVKRQGDQLRAVLLGVERIGAGDRSGESASAVIDVAGVRLGLASVQPRGRDAESFGDLYSSAEARFVLEAACEKGTLTSLLFSDQAAQASSWNW